MITLRTGPDRRHYQGASREVWHTFFATDPARPLAGGFGPIERIDEDRIAPGATLPLRDRRAAELITLVREGELRYEDSTGCAGVIRAGEFQHMTTDRGVRHRVTNASGTGWAHVFRIRLRPADAGQQPGPEQRRFTAADRRGRLLVVAAPDAQGGALRTLQDVRVHSALLDPGHHVVHELSPGRGAWLQVLEGAVTVEGVVLTAGDGAAVTEARAVSLTARSEASIVLVDVVEGSPAPARLSSAALFAMLWDETVEVLGPTATATILRRAARRALPRSPELGELDIARARGEFRYSLPRSFAQDGGPQLPMHELLDELRPLLAELTGQVVLRRLERVPQLREWAGIAR